MKNFLKNRRALGLTFFILIYSSCSTTEPTPHYFSESEKIKYESSKKTLQELCKKYGYKYRQGKCVSFYISAP